MRFHVGPLPSEFKQDPAWRSLREPSPWIMQVCALPVAIVMALIFGYCWKLVAPDLEFAGRKVEGYRLEYVILCSIPVIVVIHELIHALVHPYYGRTQSSVVGFWPSRLIFYGHYTGELSRNRFLAILIMPLLVISVIPLILAASGMISHFYVIFVAACCSTLNALFACGDVLGFVLIWAQIPSRAIVQNDGWKSYWKMEGERTV